MPIPTVGPAAHLIAWTHFEAPPPEVAPWTTDADGGQALVEFAGRACYQSWDKPNPATATNAGYVAHLLEAGHLSVLEHGTATFYFTGVSRSLTHELVRHRHFSYSQLSQRYVDGRDTHIVVPDAISAADADGGFYAANEFIAAVETCRKAYHAIAYTLQRRLERTHAVCADCCQRVTPIVVGETTYGWKCGCGDLRPAHEVKVGNRTELRKMARQAARAVLPNAAETRIVVTGNYRAWRHFIDLRATAAADTEIRALAIAVLRRLQDHAPAVFGDYQIVTAVDGRDIAHAAARERG